MTAKQDSDKSNNFNLLRFFFASLVIISHVSELQYGNRDREILTNIFGTVSFGELAVSSFFILSGFLIVKSWHEQPEPLHYFASRTLRIYPGFIVCSLICSFIIGPLYSAANYFEAFEVRRYLIGMLKLSAPVIPKVFEGSSYPDINGSMWSIAYEFKCYILVFATGILGFRAKRIFWLMLSIFCIAAYIFNANHKLEFWLFLYIRCVMPFACGACFYLYRNEITWKRNWALASFFLTVGFLFSKALVEPAIGVFFGYCTLYFASHANAMFKFDQLPDISYGIYLYAWPINKILLWHFPAMNTPGLMLAVFTLSILAGLLSWFTVEKPCLKLKKLLTTK
jgi:peptidoglycan/LPS O-acetylase OafA/YrhL